MLADSHYTDLDDGITAIDTGYLRPRMAASHLVVDGGRAAFVDTGTSHSLPRLLGALERAGLTRQAVDYVFVTHVHLDHAGGAGALMQALPEATAVVHPRGARHLVDPTKLVAGTKAVYGEQAYAELYGELPPIPRPRIHTVEDNDRLWLGERELVLIHTEGHARHHYCIYDPRSRGMFTGDSFGVSYRELDTATGAFIFPTTTPVHFDPPAAHASIERILSYDPRACYLTHYSEVTGVRRLARDLHDCLDAFVGMAQRYAGSVDREGRLRAAMFDFLSARLDEHGFAGDAASRHAVLDADIALNVQGIEFWLDKQFAARKQA
ncbi:MAG TPA: MBL fold metallo-hydrolase [Gammaproteobacteria bacterium]|nr:MBL fold metallo-hydrolase [Gammaproteobacteria bacterium]